MAEEVSSFADVHLPVSGVARIPTTPGVSLNSCEVRCVIETSYRDQRVAVFACGFHAAFRRDRRRRCDGSSIPHDPTSVNAARHFRNCPDGSPRGISLRASAPGMRAVRSSAPRLRSPKCQDDVIGPAPHKYPARRREQNRRWQCRRSDSQLQQLPLCGEDERDAADSRDGGSQADPARRNPGDEASRRTSFSPCGAGFATGSAASFDRACAALCLTF